MGEGIIAANTQAMNNADDRQNDRPNTANANLEAQGGTVNVNALVVTAELIGTVLNRIF